MKGKKFFKWIGSQHGKVGYHYSVKDMEGRGWPQWAISAYLDGVYS